jgi:hypothetical protein
VRDNKKQETSMLETRRRLISLVPLIIVVLIILIFTFYPSIRRNHVRKVLDKYEQVRIGMQESGVIRLLGRPRVKTSVKTAELGEEILAWDITIEMMDELKTKHTWLLVYSYWIGDPPLSKGIGTRIGLDVYIDKEDSTVVLVRRLR